MNRVFLSLYLLVVVSLVVVGWGADRLWQAFNPEPQISPYEQLFFDLLESHFQGLALSQAHQKSAELSVDLGQEIDIFSLEELAKSALAKKIASGEIVSVFDDKGRKSSYRRIAGRDFILRVQLKQQHPDSNTHYFALLVAFYVVIAIIIYFWIWPLSRDLRKLQNYTQSLGFDGAPEAIRLSSRSQVYSLALAFNKMTARIRELLASHKEMTYAVSHELRTPLARMKFALEMAIDSNDNTVKDRQINSVQQDVSDMETLIRELLAYAGFEQKDQQLSFARGELLPLVENLVSTHQKVQSKHKVACTITNQLHNGHVACEWYLFERCLHNLIQNAYKYAHQRIHITLAEDTAHYQVIVEDDGPGIAVEDRSKVLQAFVRLRATGEQNISGFGLGLAIVARVMKWHGGGVEVGDSRLGGAKFVLHWPKTGH